MPQLRKPISTPFGVSMTVFRLESLTFHRPTKVSVRVAAYLAGADLATAEPVRDYRETLPPEGAIAVRQANKAQFETVALQQWKVMHPELSDAAEEA